MTDGPDGAGDRIVPVTVDELARAGELFEGDEAFDTSSLAPLARETQRSGKGGRWLMVGLNPGGVILPLALLSMLVYLLSTGWFNTSAPRAGSKLPTPAASQLQGPTNDPPPSIAQNPGPAPTATGSPLVVGNPTVEAKELDQRLAEATDLTYRSRFEEAVNIYGELASLAPGDPRPEAGWAWALLLDDQAEQALPHAHRAMALDPVNPDMAAVLARVYLELGDAGRALGMAQGAVESGSGHAGAHAVLAEAYLLNGDQEQAVEAASQALALDAGNPESHGVRARLYQLVDGNLEKAVDEMRAAAELQPELWLWQYELGQLLLRVEDYRGAIASLKQALVLRPKAAILATIGEAYYRLGQDVEATTYLEQSLAAGGREADTYAFLAVVHARESRCDDARTYYQTVLAQDPSHPLAREARDRCNAPPPSPVAEASTPSSIAQATPPTPEPNSTASLPLPPLSGRIAFPAWNYEHDRYDVYVASLPGAEQRRVLEGVHQPAFSPDGNWLAGKGELPLYMNLVLAQANGSGLVGISPYIEDGLPAWSPDGLSLAFSSNRDGDRQSRVYVFDKLSFSSQRTQERVLRSDLYEVLGSFPSWTPDGHVVYAGCDYRASPIRCGLFSLSTDVGEQRPQQLTTHPDDSAPAVHGSRLAFMSRRDGNWEIYVANLDGSDLARLTDNQANDGLPTWSPDGQAIAFVSDRGGVWAVWVMSPDGSNCRKLFDIGEGGLLLDWQHERISWAP